MSTETKNSYHRADPAFTYLLSLFFLMTGVAWGSAYADGIGPTIRIALVFVLGHFLGTSLLVSTLMYFLVGRVLGKRRQGLFGPSATGTGEEGLEFGYCFDVRLSLHLHVRPLLTRTPRSPFELSCLYGSSSTSCSSSSCR
jgi:hypothetical protein